MKFYAINFYFLANTSIFLESLKEFCNVEIIFTCFVMILKEKLFRTVFYSRHYFLGNFLSH